MVRESSITILMFGWEFPPFYSGGLGIVCHDMTKALVKAGNNVIFAVPERLTYPDTHVSLRFLSDHAQEPVTQTSTKTHHYDRHNNSGYNQLSSSHGRPGYISQESFELLAELLPLDETFVEHGSLLHRVLQYADRALTMAKTENFDVIHAHDWLTFMAGVLVKHHTGKPLVVHVHNTIYDRGLGNAAPIERAIEHQGMHHADLVVPVSNYTGAIIHKYYRIPLSKIAPVHNCLDDEFSASDVDPIPFLTHMKQEGYSVILSLGRITLQKGLDYLLDAATKVIHQHPKALFIIVGDGDKYAEIIEEAARRNIANRFIMPGWAKRHQAPQFFNQADMFLLPSVSEPFGITPLEALAYDTPVILSKTTGVSEVIPNALTVDFWDSDKLADMILKGIEQPEQFKQQARLQKQSILEQTWDKAAQKIHSLYKSIITN